MNGNPIVRVFFLLALFSALAGGVAAALARTIDTRLRVDRALLQQRGALSDQFVRLLRDLERTENARAALRVIRPRPGGLVRFVEGLERAAGRAVIDQAIAAVPHDADREGQPYASPVVRYRVTLQGTGEKLGAYLRELATLPELVRVERLSVSAPPDGHVFTNGLTELVVAVTVSEAP